MSIDCWFCKKNIVEETSEKNIVYIFKKQSYADKLKKENKEDKIREQKLIIGRCDECYNIHEKCKRLSLFGIIPYFVIALGIFMMFQGKEPILVSVVLAIGAFGFGAVSYIKSRYINKKNTTALFQMEMRNEDIQHYLSDGWYR